MTPRYPMPSYPNGWFALAFSDELPEGAVVTRRFLGEDVVLFRTASGAVAAMDATCPHMGAHLGGGRVDGETIRCPFHGFCFDAKGACVSTPYGKRLPPRAQAKTIEVDEVNGVVLAWHDLAGRPPSFRIPKVAREGWTHLRHHTMTLRTHVQETAENGVDLGHFGEVHKYRNVRFTKDPAIDGPVLRASYAAARPLEGSEIDFEFDVAIWGLGYSIVEVDVKTFGIRTCQLVCACPIDEETIALRVATQMQKLPDEAITEGLFGTIFDGFLQDVGQDAPIWERKKYLELPALAEGDGPIGTYRKWARQFYSRGDA